MAPSAVKAVTLLEITTKKSSTTDDGSRGPERVSLSTEASSVLTKMSPGSLNLVTIWGAARTGKSFFMNTLARTENNVFKVAGGSDPCTVGAFISTTTRSLSEFSSDSGGPSSSSSFTGMETGSGKEPEIGFVDVEGQGDKHHSYEIKLAIPLLLLSKVVIFNWNGTINKATILDRLGMMTAAARKVDRSQRAGAFGVLVVLLRNCPNEKEEAGSHAKLFDPEDVSNAVDITDEEECQRKFRNEIREGLKNSFKGLRVRCLPAPHAEINTDRDISQSEVCPEFAAKVDRIRGELANDHLKEPHFFGKEQVVGGEMLSLLLTRVCDEVNGELKNFSPRGLMESVQRGFAEIVLARAKNLFGQSVAEEIKALGIPLASKAFLKKALETARSKAGDYFTQQNVAKSVASEYKDILDKDIAESSDRLYTEQTRQVSNARNVIENLRSRSASRLHEKAREMYAKLPTEEEQLKRSWKERCAEVYEDLQGKIKKDLGTVIIEDLKETLPTLQQIEEDVRDKFDGVVRMNINIIESEAKTKDMQQKLDQKEASEAALQQELDKSRKIREEQARAIKDDADERERTRREEREDRRAQESNRMLMETGVNLLSALVTVLKPATSESSSTQEEPDRSTRTANAATTGLHPGDVYVGEISNHADAEKKALQYEKEFPDKVWTGHWRSSYIRVRDK